MAKVGGRNCKPASDPRDAPRASASRDPGGRKETYQRSRNTTVVMIIITDHNATASICSRRFLGILAGTKLHGHRRGSHRRYSRASTYLTFAWRAATGFVTLSGVVSLDRLFLSEDADKLLGSFADLNEACGLRWAVCVALAMEVGKERRAERAER